MDYSLLIMIVYIFIFLFGVALIRAGLGQSPPKHVRTMIVNSTSHPFAGFIVGFLITALLQSSSAVMVLAVSLVAAGIIPFRQTIGVMLGSNVGTTLTLEILVFSGETLGLVSIGAGVIFLLTRMKPLFLPGTILCGVGCMFLAMDGMSSWGQELTGQGWTEWLLENDDLSAGTAVLGGTIIATIIQSSTATIAIGLQMYANDFIQLENAIAIMMGANIGTCLTAVLAALGAKRGAMQTAMANVFLNIGGVLLFLPILGIFSDMIMTLTIDPAVQVAHASVIFNLVCSLLVLPFVNPFATFIERLTGGAAR
ncbi:Na/Pi symporter [Natribacillus halophilus]|uniref:Phosphate:Na+ symporter n=1 Tax=Natribacillus halophilus TaxID=549003 RepID=A0A1G8JT53_9BACI|nr:Na/Pi symporter [Natribacillus halophilus]SDI34321.1 phosphate:Na+ symporter [Natribacillus halophilus]